MNTETNTVRYEYIEVSNDSNSEAASAELETQLIAQLEAGYLPTDVTGNDDVQFIEYSYFPQVAALLENPEDPVSLEALSSESFADFETQVAEQQDSGNDLITVSYSDGAWNSYFGEAPYDVSYTSSDDLGELIGLIDGGLKEDLTLRNIEYGDGTWLATLDDSGSASAVFTEKKFDDLTGQIETQVSEGFDLVNLEYADRTWVATFGDNPGASTYFTSEDFDAFQEEVSTQQEQGYNLVDVEYVGDAWYGVFNETLGTTETATETGNDVPSTPPTYDPAALDAIFQTSQTNHEISMNIIDNFQ